MSVEIYILPSPRLIYLWSLCSCHGAQPGPSQKSQIVKKTEQKRKMRKKRTKINCWTVTLFLPRSQLVQDFPKTMAPVVLQLVLSAVAWERIEAVTQLLKTLALDCFWIKSCAAVDLGLCCQGQCFFLLTSLSHYFIFSVHKDVGLGMLDHS